jgi:ERCC4-type nuclease
MPTKTIIDKRETKLIALYVKNNIPHETRQLDLGDILIEYTPKTHKSDKKSLSKTTPSLTKSTSSKDEKDDTSSKDEGEDVSSLTSTLTFERKSYKDLHSSIADTRYREQKSRYTQLPKGTMYYIFENNDPNFLTLGKKQFLGAYIHTMIRDGLGVFITNSTLETYEYLVKIAETLDEFGFVGTHTTIESTQIKKKKAEGIEVYKQQLCCFPSISTTKADAIAKIYPNMSELIDALNDDTFTVKGIGKVLLDKIKSNLLL